MRHEWQRQSQGCGILGLTGDDDGSRLLVSFSWVGVLFGGFVILG